MEPQARASFEAPVGQFEDRVLGLALSLTGDQERAEPIVEQAFARVLTGRSDRVDLEARLSAMTHRLARTRVTGVAAQVLPPSDVRASRDLHLRILDAIEDRQYTSQPVRSRLVALGAALLVVAAVGVVQLQRTRAEALAAAAPTIADLTPAPGAREVGVDGQFRVQFGRRPIGTPTLRYLPADGSQHLAGWDGTTLLIDYTGLRFGVRYQVTVDASYQSKLHEPGHFERQWTFMSEGPARLVATTPPDGTAMVPRNGQLGIELSRRPELEPAISITPADAAIQPGRWTNSTWLIDYSGLRPLQRYQVSVTLAASHGAAAIHREWAFTTEPGAPPAGVPVIWYSTTSPSQGPGQPGPYRLVAVDWTGVVVGTMYVPTVAWQSPDGSWLASQDGSVIGAGGRIISGLSPTGITWSDVSGRYCDVAIKQTTDNSIDQAWLETGVVGTPRHMVAVLGPPDVRAGYSVLACSWAADRAVIGYQGITGFIDVRVISLSTGRILYRHVYGGTLPNMLLSSHDGRYLAESTSLGGEPATTTIRRLPDGVTVARLGAQRVVAFAWNGSLAVTAPAWGAVGPGEIRLTDWRTGAVLQRLPLRADVAGEAVYALAEPGGSAFVVGAASAAGFSSVDGLVLIRSDGRSAPIVTGSIFLAAYPG